MRGVTDDSTRQILKGVSRSFYLSLRLLPAPMRNAASTGYLLARTSDTLADSTAIPCPDRIEALRQFSHALTGMSTPPHLPDNLINAITHPWEKKLLDNAADLFVALAALPTAEAALVRDVVSVICSGQQLDLERFATAAPDHVIALPDAAALEDYAWRVAGCVGEFWTKLGFLTLGDGFSIHDRPGLLDDGRAYGMGLQLVNILRDLPADLRCGRCYLPVADPGDRAALLTCHAVWSQRALAWIGQGNRYATALRSRRLRAASRLPALLATETLAILQGATWNSLQSRVKVPRHRVYALLLRALF